MRLRPAGSEESSADTGGSAEQKEPVDQEDPIPTQSGVEEEQQIVPTHDPLKEIPEALMEERGTNHLDSRYRPATVR